MDDEWAKGRPKRDIKFTLSSLRETYRGASAELGNVVLEAGWPGLRDVWASSRLQAQEFVNLVSGEMMLICVVASKIRVLAQGSVQSGC